MLSLIVKQTFYGYHTWKDAPPSRAYLARSHPHNFEVLLEVAVTDSNREVEFHDLADQLARELPRAGMNLPTMLNQSCESFAEHLGQRFLNMGYKVLTVSVSEDSQFTGKWTNDNPQSK